MQCIHQTAGNLRQSLLGIRYAGYIFHKVVPATTDILLVDLGTSSPKYIYI
jgi:hypothetical protein